MMLKLVKYFFLTGIVILFQTEFSFSSGNYDVMNDQLNSSRMEGRFILPSKEELKIAEELFLRLLQGENDECLVQDWKLLHFSMKSIEIDKIAYTLISEDADSRTGRGFYIVPENPQGNNVLMIPHGLFDYHTSEIGLKLMLEGNFAAASFNTLHRYGNRKLKGSEDTWDMADLADTYFTSFGKAFASVFPKGNLIQLHGFSKNKRNTREGSYSDFIISSGTDKSTSQMVRLSNCLKTKIPFMIRLYPDDVKELGGTQNIVGSLLRNSEHNGFLHFEMSLQLRIKMKDDPDIRAALLRCLQEM